MAILSSDNLEMAIKLPALDTLVDLCVNQPEVFLSKYLEQTFTILEGASQLCVEMGVTQEQNPDTYDFIQQLKNDLIDHYQNILIAAMSEDNEFLG